MGSLRVVAGFIFVVSSALAAPVPVTPKPADDAVAPSAAKLLKHRKVQKEMKLTAEQRIAILDGIADVDEAIDKKRMALLKQPNPTPDVFEKLEKEHRETNEKLFKDSAAKLLSPVQRTRLRQLHRQVFGPSAFADESVQKFLTLDEKQKKAVEEAAKQLEEKTDAYIAKLGNDDSDNLKEELLKFRQESLKSLTAALTSDQRDIWKSLLGEPVKGFDPVELWFTVIEEDDDLPVP